jgi:hypothetical protein
LRNAETTSKKSGNSGIFIGTVTGAFVLLITADMLPVFFGNVKAVFSN